MPGATDWNTVAAATTNAPNGERLVRTAEITGLNPGWIYEFQVDGYAETFRFRTMPSDLAQPVKFSVAGDADIGPDADAMAAAIAARDPAFVAMVGDHAYEDSRAANFWMWERYLQSCFTNLRAPDGRLDPRGADSASPLGMHGLSDGNVLLRYRRNSAATDLPFALESTSSLSSPAWASVNATETSLAGEWSGWRETAVPAGSGGAKFFRLRVGE